MAVGLNSNSNLFYNNGDNSFTVKALPEAARARSGRIEMVDFNNDYSLDFSNFGLKQEMVPETQLRGPMFL